MSPVSILHFLKKIIGSVLVAVLLSGCTPTESGSDTPASSSQTAEEVLDRLCSTYRSAKTYQDKATFELQYKTENGVEIESARIHVLFERPNRLKFQREGILILSDGKMTYGKPEGLDGQVVVAATSRKIKIPSFYNIAALAPLVQPGIEGPSIQLDLLLADQPLQGIRDGNFKRDLLPPESVSGHLCDRVQIQTDEGVLILWVDQASSILRRVDYPTEGLEKQWSAQGRRDIKMAVQFTDAQLNAEIDEETFQWVSAEDEIRVRNLVQPPAPLAENATDQARQAWLENRQKYMRQIDLARVEGAELEIQNPVTPIAAREEPQSLVLNEKWTNSEIKDPGNLLVITDPGNKPEQVIAIDGYHGLARLAADGKLIDKPIHAEDIFLTYLRHLVLPNGNQKTIVGAAAQSQFLVIDNEWKTELKYPEQAGIASVYDVIPADMNQDGLIEMCVGYTGAAGVHGVSFQGQRVWRNRSISDVLDLAVAHDAEGKPHLLCTHSRGSIVNIDSDGSATTIQIPGRATTQVVTADVNRDGQSEIAAVTVDSDRNRQAVGLTLDGNILWVHDLPKGKHTSPIEPIVAANWFDDEPGHWLFATPDGAIHLISADGKSVDRFATGRQLTGLATGHLNGKAALLVSSKEGITAFEVERKAD